MKTNLIFTGDDQVDDESEQDIHNKLSNVFKKKLSLCGHDINILKRHRIQSNKLK